MSKSKVEQIIIDSQSLDREMKALVYLPKTYDGFEVFPVLYFLHGRSGNETILSELELDKFADRMIDDGIIKPIIIVCPCIDNSHGMNSSAIFKDISDPCDSSRRIHLGRYEDYIIHDIIRTIDTTYHTIKNRSGRYIGGISGGGYSALHNAFNHPDLFSKVGGHMPAIEIELEEEDAPYYSNQDIWNKYDPITIAKHKELSDIEVYLDCGDRDEGRFYRGCSILHGILKANGVKSQYYLNSGYHNHDYIKANLEKYLLFYAG
jgi:enterochelin esterase-like enzyme